MTVEIDLYGDDRLDEVNDDVCDDFDDYVKDKDYNPYENKETYDDVSLVGSFRTKRKIVRQATSSNTAPIQVTNGKGTESTQSDNAQNATVNDETD